MLAIYKKELRSYFIGATGYVFVGTFLAISALLCCYTTLQANSYRTSNYFSMMVYVLIVLLPLLTMRLFAEERKTRTEQLLLTAPISLTGMVLGKFLAAFTLYLGTVLVSCINFFPLYAIAREERAAASYYNPEKYKFIGPVTAEIFGSVIGILLLGAAFIALGVFISSLTENQLSAAVITIAVILVMYAAGLLSQLTDANGLYLIDSYAVRFMLGWISVLTRFNIFTYGYLDLGAIIYYISMIAVFLFLTVRVYDKRRWMA